MCHCYPFTYTDLQHCLWGAEQRLAAASTNHQIKHRQQVEQSSQQCQNSPSNSTHDEPSSACHDHSNSGDNPVDQKNLSAGHVEGVDARSCAPRTTISTAGVVMIREIMATSLAGNAVEVLTITAPDARGVPRQQRRGIVLSCEWRVSHWRSYFHLILTELTIVARRVKHAHSRL